MSDEHRALQQAAQRGAAKAYHAWLAKHDTVSSFGKPHGNAASLR